MQLGLVHRWFFGVCLAAALSLGALAQTVSVSPTSIAFGNQAQGTSSSVHKVTLKSGQSSAITISSISTNLADYSETNNCPMSPATLAAGATCTISVTFTPTAQGTRDATLTVVDTGLSSPQLVTVTGTGTAAILESIAVSPSTASVIVADTEQFTATGTYSDGSTQNLTTTASWTSSNTSVATVGLHTGLAKGVAAGTTTITATSGKISGSASLTVTAAVLTSIAVTPATASVAAGKTEQFTATGTYNNGTTQNLTSSVTWSSSASSVATVSSGGLATSVVQGTATITATSGTVSGSATLTVTAAVLTSISVTPTSASVATGATQQFTATGTYSNGTTQNLTTTASWTSSNTSVATIKVHTGLATGVTAGTATITATSGAIHGTATLTVTAVLTSISVTPATASLAAGYTQQFTATGTYSNGTTQNLTSTAIWTSSATSIATVGSGGLATSVAPGTAAITATSGTISGSATLTVTAAVLTSISVTPNTASVAAGYTQQFTATGTYSNGTTQNLTSTAAWTSLATSIATVSSGGLATSVAQGTTTITATSGTITGSAILTVTSAVLTSLSITPSSASIASGTTQQFAATGSYSDGSTQNLTSSVSWSSSSSMVATIASSGLATGTGVGTANITATSGSITTPAVLTVSQATLVSIAVTPVNPSFALGTTQAMVATGTYTDGSTLVLTTSVAWTTANSSIATISTQGLASSVALGNTTVTATSGTVSGSTTLTVSPAVLVSIAVTPAIPVISVGTTQQFTATGTFTDGSTQNITDTAQWSSDTPSVATISNVSPTQGLASSVGEGTANITATSGTISGSTPLTVTSATLESIAVTPTMPSIASGTAQQFTATGTYSDGSTQNLTSTAMWSSDTPSTATVNNAGLAQSVGIGTANITATSGAVSGTTMLTVTAATLVSIAITPPTATIPLGTTQQFTATGTYTDGSTQDLTQSGQWSSSVGSVATISNTTGTAGLASTLSDGTTTIGISSGSVSATATLVVNPAALVSIAITPQTPTIALGTTQQFTATGTYTDGSTQNLTTVATWRSSSATVAIVSNAVGSNGLATSAGQGTATISATSGSISASSTLTVTGPTLVSIAITPAGAWIPAGTSLQFDAVGTYTDGSAQDLTSSTTWTSSAPAVAPVSAGLVTGSSLGTASISASSGTVTGSASVIVTAAALVSVAVAPANASITSGTAQQFTATGTYSDGSTQNLTNTVTWTSSATSIATVSAGGLATGIAEGIATITANSGTISGGATLTVTLALVSISITPQASALLEAATQQFTATGTYSDGSAQNITAEVAWSSSQIEVAAVSNNAGSNGIATGVGVGTTTIIASLGALSASTTLMVEADSSGTVIGVPAITDNPAYVYKGLNLGQYNDLTTGEGTSTPPAAHDAWGQSLAASIKPIDGAVVGLITGLSNAVLFGTQQPTNFVNQTAALREAGTVKSSFHVVCGARGSTPSSEWENNTYGAYTTANAQLANAGFTPSQVQVMFIENGDANEPPGTLQTSTSLLPPAPHIPPLSSDPDYWNLIYNMGNQIRYLRTQYPNLQQVFLHARIYAGYAQTTASNPEPFALEQSLAIKYLVMAQSLQLYNGTTDPVAGDLLTNCPWVGWGYYMWANGETPRADGLTWNAATDYQTTGGSAYIHPSATGVEQQVDWPVNGATAFYLASPYSMPWYAENEE
jgi:uncharacterized protein YjdB